MSNRNYQAGVRLEREIANLFKAHGWSAQRTAGSHSPWDVLCVVCSDDYFSAHATLRSAHWQGGQGTWERLTRGRRLKLTLEEGKLDDGREICLMQCKVRTK